MKWSGYDRRRAASPDRLHPSTSADQTDDNQDTRLPLGKCQPVLPPRSPSPQCVVDSLYGLLYNKSATSPQHMECLQQIHNSSPNPQQVYNMYDQSTASRDNGVWGHTIQSTHGPVTPSVHCPPLNAADRLTSQFISPSVYITVQHDVDCRNRMGHWPVYRASISMCRLYHFAFDDQDTGRDLHSVNASGFYRPYILHAAASLGRPRKCHRLTGPIGWRCAVLHFSCSWTLPFSLRGGFMQ